LSIPNTKGPKLLCEIQEVAVALILAARDGRKPDEIPSAWLQIILCSNQTWSCCTSVNPKFRVITARPPSHQISAASETLDPLDFRFHHLQT
jgi:hypothetical protein